MTREAEMEEAILALRAEYVREVPGQLHELEDALARSRTNPDARAGARRIAHRLRGSAGSYGFPEASEAAGCIEDVLSADGPLTANAWIEVETAFVALRAAIRA